MLWDKDYNGKAEYHFNSRNKDVSVSHRFLKSDCTNTVIRDFRQISIIEKAFKYNEERFSSIVSSRNPYGLYADLFNIPEKYADIKILNVNKNNLYKIYGVKGKKGSSKRVFGYIDKKCIKKNLDIANNYKLFFSKAYTTTSTVPPKVITGTPYTVCTETFLNIGCFSNDILAKNCLQYIKTKFFRALLFFNRHSLNISRKSFNLIPLLDFNKEWTDEKLYKRYNLSDDEIKYIETIIKPIE